MNTRMLIRTIFFCIKSPILLLGFFFKLLKIRMTEIQCPDCGKMTPLRYSNQKETEGGYCPKCDKRFLKEKRRE